MSIFNYFTLIDSATFQQHQLQKATQSAVLIKQETAEAADRKHQFNLNKPGPGRPKRPIIHLPASVCSSS